MGPAWRLVNWFGRTPAGVWTIKHVVSPLDRRLYRRTGGRLVSTGRPRGPIVLLTTTGRRTGHQHTTPVFHLQDGEQLIVCNVTPGGERPNPWPLNLRADPWRGCSSAPRCEPIGRVRPPRPCLSGYWPQLLRVWPAYARFWRQGGRRSVFVLQPTTPVGPGGIQ